MSILRSIYVYANIGISLFTKGIMLQTYKRKKTKMNKNEYESMINRIATKWAKAQLKRTGARIKVTGTENIPECPVVFVSNHQSNVDIAVFLAEIEKNKGFVAKVEMLKVPSMRDWMKELNCVFMDRDDIKQSARTILEAIEIVKNGYSMVIFPEGTRSKGVRLGEFKAGSMKLATKSRAPIVPITINGSYKLMEANKNRIVPADITLTIHPPIETANMTKEEELLLAEKVKDIIAGGL